MSEGTLPVDRMARRNIEPVGLSLEEAAAALGVSERLVEELEADGLLRRIDFGVTKSGEPRRIRRFSIDVIRDFAAGRRDYPAPVDLDSVRRSREGGGHDQEKPQTDLPIRRPVADRSAGRPRKPRSSSAPLPLRGFE